MKKLVFKSIITLICAIFLVFVFRGENWINILRYQLIWIVDSRNAPIETLLYLGEFLNLLLQIVVLTTFILLLWSKKNYGKLSKSILIVLMAIFLLVILGLNIVIFQFNSIPTLYLIVTSLYAIPTIAFFFFLVYQPRWQLLGNTRQQFAEAKAEFIAWRGKTKSAKDEELQSVKRELEEMKAKMKDMEEKK